MKKSALLGMCLAAILSAGTLLASAQSHSPSTQWHWNKGKIMIDSPERPAGQKDVIGLTLPKMKTVRVGFPDFVIAYPKKYKSYNFSRQECKKQGFSRIGGRACYFTRLFARLPKQQKQPLIIKHLQTYFEKVTKSGENISVSSPRNQKK